MRGEFVKVTVKEDCSFFHEIWNKLKLPAPEFCDLPLFSGMSNYAPLITLSSEYIKQNFEKDIIGVYVVLIWSPRLNRLEPIYLGSGNVRRRLDDHIRYMSVGKNSINNTTPKYFYELLKQIGEGYWMVTWSNCENHKLYENEIYHVLKQSPYFVNSRAVIKDKRSYLQHQVKVAKRRSENIQNLIY